MAYTPDNPYLPGDPYAYDLKWLVSEVKQLIADYQAQQAQLQEQGDDIQTISDGLTDLRSYVANYFDNLDITQEINDKLQAMLAAGDFDSLLNNDNLLINPWFTVNQRGASSYSDAGYTVDMWHRPAADATGVQITLGSVTLPQVKGDVYQAPGHIISAESRIWTVSAIIDGTLYTHSFTSAGDGVFHYYGDVIGLDNLRWNIIENWNANTDLIGIDTFTAAADHVIKAIKLEAGPLSTLPSDAAPIYGDELQRCLYWFERMDAPLSDLTISTGVAQTATIVYAPLQLAPKRTTPAVIQSADLLLGKGTYTLQGATSVAVNSGSPNGSTTIAITCTGVTVDEFYRVGIRMGQHLDFTAEF